MCGYGFHLCGVLPELVSYGRHNEICVVLSWAISGSKPAFRSLPKFHVKWCSFLPPAALSSCFVVLAGLDEASKLAWGKRLLQGLEGR